MLALHSRTASKLTSSPSPIIKKSKICLYGSGFAVTTGPPAKISGKSSFLSSDFSGIPYFSSIENISKKSRSKENEKAIISTFAGLNDKSVESE